LNISFVNRRTGLLEKDNFLRDFQPNERYLVGVSGGRDSVALLHWLREAGYNNLIVCHLNHQLRGQSASADARFVRKLAAKYALLFELGQANVRAIAAREKISIETAAREARYSFFGQVAERSGCQTIFLGHHADDLVETLLLNLFRGTGASGLVGIRGVTIRREGDVSLTVGRPFLGIWRSDINQYVKQNRLDFREDRSNKDLTPLRNRVRQRIIPYLEKTIGRNIRQNIWKTATILAEEENFFESLLPKNLENVAELAVEPLRQLSVALQRRMLRRWLRAAEVRDLTFELVERVRALIDHTNRVAKTNLPGNRHARRRAGKLFLE
jgi:tRNA(Ile)-lysidine synthase